MKPNAPLALPGSRTNGMKAGRPSKTRDRGPLRWDLAAALRAALLVVLVAIVYAPTLNNRFIWDDGQYVTHNETLRTVGGLADIWLKPEATPQYYPLVHTTFWFEYHLWGVEPRGYHVVNLALHALSAVLVWRLLLTLRVPGAWLAAALFAVHPVFVESVAWVTERKNVLSLPLALGSILAYLKFSPPRTDDRPPETNAARLWRWYALSLGLFLGALLSKTVTASVPAVILVIYWWQEGRVRMQHVLRLLPFFAIGLLLALNTARLERTHVGAEGEEWLLTPVERVLIAGRAVWFYAAKLFFPYPLVFFYPRWVVDSQAWWQYLFPTAAIVLLVVLWLARNRIGRGPLAAALIFGGVLVPALGFFNVYPFRYSFVADHFQYHAAIALVALAAAAVATRRMQHDVSWFAPLATVGLLVPLILLARQQTLVYRDVQSLWEDTIAKNPDCWAARANLGDFWMSRGKTQEAIKQYAQALETVPDAGAWQLYLSMGNCLQDLRRPQQALAYYEQALRTSPPNYHGAAEVNLASCLQDLQRFEEAMTHYREAMRLSPEVLNPTVHGNIAGCLARLGNHEAALGHYRQALEMNPAGDWQLFFGMAESSHETRRYDQAAQLYDRTLQANPRFIPARNRLARSLLMAGRLEEAAKVLELNLNTQLPDDQRAEANELLAAVLRKQGKEQEAVAAEGKAKQLRADAAQRPAKKP